MKTLILRINSKILKTISNILPISNIFVFSSNTDFTDNSKAIFDYLIKHNYNDKFKFIWLSNKESLINSTNYKNVSYFHVNYSNILSRILIEIRVNLLLMRTKCYFFSHTNYCRFVPRKNQVFYNLTHGTPLKDSTGRHHSQEYCNNILSTSSFAAKLRVSTYNLNDLSKFRILGFPRNDLLFNQNITDIRTLLNISEKDRILIWMPTYRRHKDGKTNDSGKSLGEIDIPIFTSHKDWINLNKELELESITLIVKPHPAQDMNFFDAKEFSKIRLVDNQILLEKNIDLYQLLSITNGLITDYSSVYMDYLLLDKPVGFTIEDISSYNENVGFMVDDVLEYLPGYKIENKDNFLDFIKDFERKDLFKQERRKICKLFNDYEDGNSSYRIITDLKERGLL